MFGTKIIIDEAKIQRLLSRNVEEIFVKESLEKRLKSGKQLRVKLGFDPTGSKIHIGRAIVLHKLREFQDLGHKIVFLVGDFTARVGDPSDKLEKRPMLTREKIKENLRDYKSQVGKIVDLRKAEFVFNSKWLSKLKFDEIADLAETFSVSQMTSRRNFKERLEKGDEVSLREFLYPLMQGYDSVVLKADVEIGGFDQLFNLKAGRIIQKHYGQREQEIMTCVMLDGTDGRKMSTSWGNVINISDEPNDMYGKVMSMADELIMKYFRCVTDLDLEKIDQMEKDFLSGKLFAKDAKMMLAREIVKRYWGEEKSKKAEENFIQTFSKGSVPDEIEEAEVSGGSRLADILFDNKIVSSKSEFSRLISEGAIKNMETEEKISDREFKIEKITVLKIGKKRFIKIKVK